MPTELVLNILIIDDDHICSNILKRIIDLLRPSERNIVVNVTIHYSAEGALNELEKNTTKYDIIFTDIEMGGIHGDEMALKIRESFKDIFDGPIYAITANYNIFSCERYKQAGITECIAKPAGKKYIHDIINERIQHKIYKRTIV